MQVLLFLLQTLFFILVACALLRAWMNHIKLHMSVQPGRFVMAVTDWLVKPLRRVLPGGLGRSRVDWGSLLAAVVLCQVYAALALLVMSGWDVAVHSPGLMLALALQFLARSVLQGLSLLLLVYAILSWVQPQSPVMGTLDRLVGPLVRPIRRLVPPVGGVDLSVLLLIVALQVGLMLIG